MPDCKLATVQKAWQKEQWASHVPRLAATLQIAENRLTERHVEALWHLCQQEAGLWNITHQACSLFSSQVELTSRFSAKWMMLMCWTDPKHESLSSTHSTPRLHGSECLTPIVMLLTCYPKLQLTAAAVLA